MNELSLDIKRSLGMIDSGSASFATDELSKGDDYTIVVKKDTVQVSLPAFCIDSQRSLSEGKIRWRYNFLHKDYQILNKFYYFMVGSDSDTLKLAADSVSIFNPITILDANVKASDIAGRLNISWQVDDYKLLSGDIVRTLKGTVLDIVRELLSPLNFFADIATFSVADGKVFCFYRDIGLPTSNAGPVLKTLPVSGLLDLENSDSETAISKIYLNKKAGVDMQGGLAALVPVTEITSEESYYTSPYTGTKYLVSKVDKVLTKYGDTVIKEAANYYSYGVIEWFFTPILITTFGGLTKIEEVDYEYDIAPSLNVRSRKLINKTTNITYIAIITTPTGIYTWTTRKEKIISAYSYNEYNELTAEANSHSTFSSSGSLLSSKDESISYQKITGDLVKVTTTLKGVDGVKTFVKTQIGGLQVPQIGNPSEDSGNPEYDIYDINNYGKIEIIDSSDYLTQSQLQNLVSRGIFFLIKKTINIKYAGIVDLPVGSIVNLSGYSFSFKDRLLSDINNEKSYTESFSFAKALIESISFSKSEGKAPVTNIEVLPLA